MQTEKQGSSKRKFNKEFLIFYIEQLLGIFALMLGYLIGVRLPFVADLVAGGIIALASIVYCMVQHDNDRNIYGYINPVVVSFACGMAISAYFAKYKINLFFGNYPVFLMTVSVVTLNLFLLFLSSKAKGSLFLITNILSALMNVATIVFAIIALCKKSNDALTRAHYIEFGLIFLFLGLVVLGETIYLLFGGECRVMLNLFWVIAFFLVFLVVLLLVAGDGCDGCGDGCDCGGDCDCRGPGKKLKNRTVTPIPPSYPDKPI